MDDPDDEVQEPTDLHEEAATDSYYRLEGAVPAVDTCDVCGEALAGDDNGQNQPGVGVVCEKCVLKFKMRSQP